MSDPFKDYVPLTSVPQPDPQGLTDLANQIRQTINPLDPKSLYFGRPDLAQEAEIRLKAVMIRANVEEVSVTPQMLAERQHAAAWPSAEAGIPPMLVELMDDRLEALEAQPSHITAKAYADLRQRLGPAAHDALLADAQAALTEKLPDVAKGDLSLLRVLAADTRYRRGYAASRPRR